MSDARTRRNEQFQSSIFEPTPISSKKEISGRENYNAGQQRKHSYDTYNSDYSRSRQGEYRKAQENRYDEYETNQYRRNNKDERQNLNRSQNEGSNSYSCKPNDTENLLGSDQTNYYQRENKKKPSYEFEPKYAETSAFDRKYVDLYGNSQSSIPSYPREEDVTSESRDISSRQRKQDNMESNIFYPPQYRNFKQEIPEEAQSSQFSPESRSAEMRESSVFGKQGPRQTPNHAIETSNDDKRRKNHMYSDIFGEPEYELSNKKQDKLIAATQKWSENDARTYTKEEDYDVHKFKSKNLWGDEKHYQERNLTPKPARIPAQNPQQYKTREMASSMQDYTEFPSKQVSEPAIVEYDLENLPRNTTKETLKSICSSVHIVSIQIDTDNLTGFCKGTGKIMIRTSANAEKDLQRLQLDLADEDIVLKIHRENVGLKSNYSELSGLKWNDPHIVGTPSEHSVRNKESYNRPALDETYMANIQWQRTKNPKYEYR